MHKCNSSRCKKVYKHAHPLLNTAEGPDDDVMIHCTYRFEKCQTWVCECNSGPLMCSICKRHYPWEIKCDDCGIVYLQLHDSEAPYFYGDDHKWRRMKKSKDSDEWICDCIDTK